jgi:hypothetical protein
MSVKHEGRYPERTELNSFHGRIEKLFAEEWRKANHPPCWLNHGLGVLEHLLVCDETNFSLKQSRELTQAEATAAATVVQWLGTAVGWQWLCDCMHKAGFLFYQNPHGSVAELAKREALMKMDQTIRQNEMLLKSLRSARKRIAGRL